MKLLSRRAVPLAAAACIMVLLGACSGGGAVGHGNAPKVLVITQGTSATQVASVRAHACLPQPISVLLFFDDGSFGNFTGRVVWSSSNPGTVAVSNGDYPVPGVAGAFYPSGTLVPLAPGTAEITATYSALSAVVSVSVGSLDNAKLKSVIEGFYVPPAGNNIRMGIGTTYDVALTAELDNVETNVSAYASWGFQNPNPGVATIAPTASTSARQAGGRIAGVGFGGPLVAQATLPLCPLVQTSTNVTVRPVQNITVQPQFTGNPALVVGNQERMFVFADLGNGPEQDISSQAILTANDSTIVRFGASSSLFGLGTPGYYMQGLSQGGTVISAAFTGAGVQMQSSTMRVGVVNADLLAIAVTGAAPSALLPGVSFCNGATAGTSTPAYSQGGSLSSQQFCALGTYGGGMVQDITPEASWTVSDTRLATIGSTTTNAGVFTSDTDQFGSVNVTATAPSSASGTIVVNTATTAITVNPH
ncbi:MAG: hypothetical protein ISP90_06820 [Nevskia sp.]|nr:hypothetical protein [Nevskia sp.]